MFQIVPTGFVPDEDQGFLIVVAQGPPGTSLEYTDRIMAQAQAILRSEPEIVNIFSVSGFSFFGSGANNGIMFASFTPWSERRGEE